MYRFARYARLILVSVFLLVLAIRPGLRAADRDADRARERWMTGYLKLERAAKAAEEGRTAFALQLFEEAHAVFSEVERQFPDWNPKLVRFRLDFCRQQIRFLEEAAAVDVEKMNRSQLVSEVRRLRAKLSQPDVQRQRLESEVERLEAAVNSALERVRTAGATAEEAEARRHLLLQENQTLVTRLETMKSTLDYREKELARFREAAGDARALRESLAEHARRAESAAALERQNQALKEGVDELEARVRSLTAAADQVAVLRARVEELEAKEERLQASCKTLTEAVVKAGAARKAAESQAQAATRDLTALRETLEAATEELDTIKPLANETRAAKERVATLQQTMARQHVELEQLKTTAAEDRQQLQQARRELADARAKVAVLNQSLIEAGAGDVARLKSEHESLRRAHAALQEDLTASAEALAKAEAEMGALTAARDSQRREVEARNQREEERRDHVRTRLLRAATALEQGRRQEAEEALRQVLAADPDHRQALHRLGALLAANGEDVEAEAVLLRAAGMSRRDPDVLLRLGAVLLRRQRPREAAAALLEATAREPEQAAAHHFLGLALAELGWTRAAESALRESFRLDRTNAATAYDLAVVLISARPPNIQEARAWYERALELGVAADPAMESAMRNASTEQ